MKLTPATRSVLLSIICGMMAAAFLHERGVVDLSFGFPSGGAAEGVSLAVVGGVGGYAILLAFRIIRNLTGGAKGEDDDG